MRVLHFAPRVCWPLDTGAKLRNYHLARVLAQRAQVTLLAFDGASGALINSVCGVTSVGSFSGHGVELSCQDTNAGLAPQALLAGQVRGGPGQGELHIQAPDAVLRLYDARIIVTLPSFPDRIRSLALRSLSENFGANSQLQ